MRKIFFTGGAGLLSLNWSIYCEEKWEIFLGTFNRNISPWFGQTISLSQSQSVAALTDIIVKISPDVVVNSAALTNIEFCEQHPMDAHRSNVDFACNVATVCNQLKIPLVHISTDHLFDGTVANVTEEEDPCPLNVYAQTKADAEIKVLNMCKKAIIIRTNFFGWGTSYRPSFTDRIIEELSHGRPFYGFKDVFFTPILVLDLAKCIFQIIDNGLHGIFNISSDHRISKYEFALSVARVFDLPQSLVKPISIRDKPDLVLRPSDMSLSNAKVSKLLMREIGSAEDCLRRLRNQSTNNSYKKLLTL